ncbi:MAG TPA: hypothetical protein VLJ59_00580 [Mycobacteriales bacterium]|nr:hypothetical protein [Mycobacteriales bacterium]
MGRCNGNDGDNTVGWGSLRVGYLAITCVYYADGKIASSDIMINKS